MTIIHHNKVVAKYIRDVLKENHYQTILKQEKIMSDVGEDEKSIEQSYLFYSYKLYYITDRCCVCKFSELSKSKVDIRVTGVNVRG